MEIPKFGTIQGELLAKGLAIHMATAPEVAADICDTMARASIIIGECINALQEIKRIGINEDGHLSKTAMRADEVLILIQENTK
jgi:hypothetical protein